MLFNCFAFILRVVLMGRAKIIINSKLYFMKTIIKKNIASRFAVMAKALLLCLLLISSKGRAQGGCLPGYSTFVIDNLLNCGVEVWVELQQCSNGNITGFPVSISANSSQNVVVPGWIGPNPDIDVILKSVNGTNITSGPNEYNPCFSTPSCLPGGPAPGYTWPTGDATCPDYELKQGSNILICEIDD